MSLSAEIDSLLPLTEEFPPNMQAISLVSGNVANAIQYASTDEKNESLQRLKSVIQTKHVAIASVVSVLAGALVEAGGDPRILVSDVLERVRKMLPDVQRYVDICNEKALEADSAMGTLGAEFPDEVNSWQAYNFIYRAVVAMLSRSKEARKQATHDITLIKGLAALREYGEGTIWLYKMLRVLDDETLIALHPETKTGFEIKISGIADNFQLHTLVADAVIGNAEDGLIPLDDRPNPAVVRVMRGESDNFDLTARGFFNFYNWFALEPDGTLDATKAQKKQAWIWNEAIPGDIMPFDGTRLFLLGEAPYVRSWNAVRVFDGMMPEFELTRQLSETEVQDWLQKIQAKTVSGDAISSEGT